MNQTTGAPGVSLGRIAWIDIAKAMAAWMVVTSHLLRQGMLTDYLAAISVSIFYVLAGVTIHAHTDLRAFLVRLLRRIVLPYLAVGLISIVIYRFLGNYAAAGLGTDGVRTTLREDLWHLLYGSSVGGRMKWNESLWFLPCYCLVILLAEIIERTGRLHRVLPAVLYTVASLIGYGMIYRGMMGLPWHLETALLVLLLCGMGRYLARGLRMWHIHPLAIFLAGLSVFYIGIEMFAAAQERAAGGSLSLRAVHLAGAPETYCCLAGSSAGLLLILWALLQGRQDIPWLPAVGAHSLDIVLWNKFPVLIVQTVIPAWCPGITAAFVGGENTQSLLIASILAIPCIAACLVWCMIYRQLLTVHTHSVGRYS